MTAFLERERSRPNVEPKITKLDLHPKVISLEVEPESISGLVETRYPEVWISEIHKDGTVHAILYAASCCYLAGVDYHPECDCYRCKKPKDSSSEYAAISKMPIG